MQSVMPEGLQHEKAVPSPLSYHPSLKEELFGLVYFFWDHTHMFSGLTPGYVLKNHSWWVSEDPMGRQGLNPDKLSTLCIISEP